MATGSFPSHPGMMGAAPSWTVAPSLDAIVFQGQFLRQGHQGPAVAEIQRLLGLRADGHFGPGTHVAVETFQRSMNRPVMPEPYGVVGRTTLQTLLASKGQWLAAPSLDEVRSGSRLLWLGEAGPAVKELQRLLFLPPQAQDGYFGQSTHAAVVSFQRASGMPVPPGLEGVVWRALFEALVRRSQPGAGGISLQQLRAIMPKLPEAQASAYLPYLNAAMAQADISTPRRQAAFLAQLAHESGELRYWEELNDGSAYEGRKSLGNTQKGDGPRYKGRGPIQLTGRNNYRAAGQALGVDLENNPERAKAPDVGFRVAAWFWSASGLNPLADASDFREITRRINGGYNGLPQREAYHARALQFLNA